MSKKEWGPACWYLFHGLASKVKEEEFHNVKNSLWSQIEGVCINLPCPDCKSHATELIQKSKKDLILSSKRNLEVFLFDFHNLVNKRNGTRQMSMEEYDNLYKKANLMAIINNFIAKFATSTRNNKLMTDVMHRQFFISSFISWINSNISKFNLR